MSLVINKEDSRVRGSSGCLRTVDWGFEGAGYRKGSNCNWAQNGMVVVVDTILAACVGVPENPSSVLFTREGGL